MSLHWIGLYAAITVITTGRIQKESITASKKQKRHWNRCLRKDIGNDSHCFCWQQHIQFPLVCLQSYAVWMCKDAEGTCNILAHPNSIRYDDLLRGSRNTLSRKSRKFTQNSWHNRILSYFLSWNRPKCILCGFYAAPCISSGACAFYSCKRDGTAGKNASDAI